MTATSELRTQHSVLLITHHSSLITHHYYFIITCLSPPATVFSRLIIMSIKSDKWIRRMAVDHKMIEPFEPDQVKEIDGRRIVSYGTSSYGYDIRCADEFKLFTNINSTIVDP